MKVIFLTTLEIDSGGAERLLLEEADYFRQQGEEVKVLVKQHDQDKLEELGFGELNVQEFNIDGMVSTSRSLRQQFKEESPDLIVSHYIDKIAYLSTRGLSTDVSYHINGSGFWFSDNVFLEPHKRKNDYEKILQDVEGHKEFRQEIELPFLRRVKIFLSEKIRKKALKRSKFVTTISDQVGAELEFLYDTESEIIHPGVGDEFFDVEKDNKVELESDNPILNISRLDERKRNKLLIKSFSKLLEERKDIHLYIGGKGDERDNLEELASDLEIKSKVTFLGYVPEEKLASYYREAEVFAHPAWVAYGLSPLEAYAAETKTLISTDTMAKDILEGKEGVIVSEPKSEDLKRNFNELIDSKEEPKKKIVPKWEDYCQKKYKMLTEKVDDLD